MFQDGGLNDQGGSKDPVSGNDVPSGSLKEEVRDDIDAKLSPGEFVFPADVVRFIGLEKLMLMRDKAKRGLARMEEMGQMGNSDEATIDDDVPFGMEDLIIVAGSPDNEMSKGGVINARDGVFVNDGRRGRGAQLFGDIGDGYLPPTTYYNPDTGQEMVSTKIGGKFFPPLPKGFIEKPKKAEEKPRDVKSETAKVESTLGSGEVDGGPDRSDVSAGEMTMSEKADMPDFSQTTKDMIGGAVGLGVGMLGMGMTQQAAKSSGMFGISQTAADLAKAGVKADFQSYDQAKATMASMTAAQRTAQRDRDMQTVAERAQKSYEDSVGAPAGSTGTVGVGTVGGIPSPMAVDRFGTVTDLSTGDIIGGKDAKDFKDMIEAKAFDEAFSMSQFGGEADASSVGPAETGSQAQMSDPAETGVAENEQDDMGVDAEVAVGGFIPKKKKQKKMKRGGLASR